MSQVLDQNYRARNVKYFLADVSNITSSIDGSINDCGEKRREEKSVGRRAVLELFIASPSDLLRGLEAI